MAHDRLAGEPPGGRQRPPGYRERQVVVCVKTTPVNIALLKALECRVRTTRKEDAASDRTDDPAELRGLRAV